jgi:hypothetical protein
MDRDELFLREKIRTILETYSFEELLEENEMEIEDAILFLYLEYGLKLPEMEPLS